MNTKPKPRAHTEPAEAAKPIRSRGAKPEQAGQAEGGIRPRGSPSGHEPGEEWRKPGRRLEMARASERNEGEARGAFNRKPEARHDRENSQRAEADGSLSRGFVPTISARDRMARASPCADRPISAQPTARAWLPVRFVRFCVRVGWLGSPCALGVGLGFIVLTSAKCYTTNKKPFRPCQRNGLQSSSARFARVLQ